MQPPKLDVYDVAEEPEEEEDEQQQQQQYSHSQRPDAAAPTHDREASVSSSLFTPSTSIEGGLHSRTESSTSINSSAGMTGSSSSNGVQFAEDAASTGTSSPARFSTAAAPAANKVPAAGAGTRITPRAVPRSSSSLRHISSNKSRTSSFGRPLPEDRDPSSIDYYEEDRTTTGGGGGSGSVSLAQRSVDAYNRKYAQELEQEDLFEEDQEALSQYGTSSDSGLSTSDSEEDECEVFAHKAERKNSGGALGLALSKEERIKRSRKGKERMVEGGAAVGGEEDLSSRNPSPRRRKGRRGSSRFLAPRQFNLADSTSSETEPIVDFSGSGRLSLVSQEGDSGKENEVVHKTNHHEEEGDSYLGARPKVALHTAGPGETDGLLRVSSRLDLDSPLPGLPRRAAPTPGPTFSRPTHAAQTPGLDGTAPLTPDHDPRQRMEWQTMLLTVLGSEVLRSETKRITSVDAPDLSKTEIIYQRWLEMRAYLRGRGHTKASMEAEGKLLAEGWPVMMREVIDAVKNCRLDKGKAKEREKEGSADGKAAASEGGATESADASTSAEGGAMQASREEKDRVFEEVGELLEKVHRAEEQFPSTRKMREIVPEWFEPDLQARLSALYTWHNTLSQLRQQIKVLQEWTGSPDLDITGHPSAHPNVPPPPEAQAQEESTFVERLMKENNLKQTFEKRTLKALNAMLLKAKEAIKQQHVAFADLALPSFEPELVQLIRFPPKLMEGALTLRLDYASKLKEPSVLIVDSLTDDVRSALALACRVKLQYNAVMVPDPDNGWDLPHSLDDTYDAVLRDALRFFFRLLNFKLKGSVFFKETEILEPEWLFLSTAVSVINRGDIIVAKSVTKIVNKLFARIVTYFERELSAPSTSRGLTYKKGTALAAAAATSAPGGDAQPRAPSTAGGLTKGKVRMTLAEKARWIRAVFDNVRIRSRKLLGFARDIRARLDNAAEYDLASLSPPSEGGEDSPAKPGAPMDLGAFLQRLINAGFFLVYTWTLEESGVYLIADPTLHDKPELIQELLGKCLRRIQPHEEEDARTMEANANLLNEAFDPDGLVNEEKRARAPSEMDEEVPGDDSCNYLLLLSPREAFFWTGNIMQLPLPALDVHLQDSRLRLVADGPRGRLQMCKEHLYSIFANDPAPKPDGQDSEAQDAAVAESNAAAFPLETVVEHMAHITSIQKELRLINKGVYMLSDAIIRAVPQLRRNLRNRRFQPGVTADGQPLDTLPPGKGGDCDELIQNCFSMAAEQGLRALPFIESARLQREMNIAIAKLSIDWVAFICDDCVPTDRKTFKWAVAALENAWNVSRGENIIHLSEADFALLKSKVASCMALLISQFDIMGARSSAAKAREEQERMDAERLERSRAEAEGLSAEERAARSSTEVPSPPDLAAMLLSNEGIVESERRWLQKIWEWEAARQDIEMEQRLIGRVLDETRIEDRGLQELAQSSSRIQIRWQQGRFVGAGTFGTVYSAMNLDSGDLMAVKEIRFQDIASHPDFFEQIKAEMNVMEMLSHPNIAQYYGIEVHRDKVYIFEEFCQGGSLANLLEHGRIEDEAVIQIYTLQMLDGLVYLHSKGIVHRDIKPDNVLLDHLGVIKFVDFGAAKVLAKNSKTVQRSRRPGGNAPIAIPGAEGKAGGIKSLQGTPMYMSPEVIKGESRGRRGAMDVWSVGCVVLEFATGRRPWSQLDNEWAIMFHIGMAQQHPPLPEPGQLSELGIDFIRQCLMIDPYERPSAAEMREHAWIQNLLDELAQSNEESGPTSAGAGADSTPGAGGSEHHMQLQLPTDVSKLTEDSAAGVAAMAQTPGLKTLNSYFHRATPGSESSLGQFSAQTPSTGVTSISTSSHSLSQHQQAAQATQQQQPSLK